MNTKEFRVEAHRVVEWIADYLEGLRELPVFPNISPGEIRSRLPPHAPLEGEQFGSIFQDFLQLILPGMTHWQHPRFFAFFPANSSPPSVLAEFLIAALGAQCMGWETSPAATELEEQMLVWMRELYGFPESWEGVIQPGVTIAGICSLHAARHAKETRREIPADATSRYSCYFSAEAHSSVQKFLRVAGCEPDLLRKIEVDDGLALNAEAFRTQVQKDVEAGLTPLFAVATIGTTSTGAVDPVAEMAETCAEFGIWLHVDAAYFGSALLLPEYRHLGAGLDRADSIAINPNKEMFVNFECTLHFFRSAALIKQSLSVLPPYLKGDYDKGVKNFRDYGLALGRRFNALKLWFVLRSYGVTKIREMLRAHIDLAERFAELVRSAPDFELVGPRSLSVVCFRCRPQGRSEAELEQINSAIKQRANDSGQVYLSSTWIRGIYAIRFVPATTYVSSDDIDAAWELLSVTARKELASNAVNGLNA